MMTARATSNGTVASMVGEPEQLKFPFAKLYSLAVQMPLGPPSGITKESNRSELPLRPDVPGRLCVTTDPLGLIHSTL